MTRREKFLGEMERVVPWKALVRTIEPHYPKGGHVGPPPIGWSAGHVCSSCSSDTA
jgi:IS5 family transposase